MGKIKLLTEPDIQLKTKRIALQFLEEFPDEKSIVVCGIKGGGFEFATRLSREITAVETSLRLTLHAIEFDKTSPTLPSINTPLTKEEVKEQLVLLVDDVLNTGRTMAFAVAYFLPFGVKALRTAVLVNRSHCSFPVHADYTGLSIATTLKEHISVSLSEGDSEAWLE